MKLEGRVAIVTGGAQGIGRAYARRFAAEGASVGILDLRADQAKGVQREIEEAGGRALAAHADVTDEESLARAAAAVADQFGGRIDVLVNNAAVYYDLDVRDQTERLRPDPRHERGAAVQ